MAKAGLQVSRRDTYEEYELAVCALYVGTQINERNSQQVIYLKTVISLASN